MGIVFRRFKPLRYFTGIEGDGRRITFQLAPAAPTTMQSIVHSEPVEVRHNLPPLRALTSLRFFAAMYVVLFHESHNPGHIVLFPLAARFVASGFTAVTLFFVLSGFILAYNYDRIRSRREFWISRFARIYPVYFLSLLPVFITPHWSHLPRPGALGVILTLLLLQS